MPNCHTWQLTCPEDVMLSLSISERLSGTVERGVSPALPCTFSPYHYLLILSLTFTTPYITMDPDKFNREESAVMVFESRSVTMGLEGRRGDQRQL